MVVLRLTQKTPGEKSHEIEFDSTFFPNSVSKKEEEVKKLKEKVSDIVHQEDKTKQAKLKLVYFIKATTMLITDVGDGLF